MGTITLSDQIFGYSPVSKTKLYTLWRYGPRKVLESMKKSLTNPSSPGLMPLFIESISLTDFIWSNSSILTDLVSVSGTSKTLLVCGVFDINFKWSTKLSYETLSSEESLPFLNCWLFPKLFWGILAKIRHVAFNFIYKSPFGPTLNITKCLFIRKTSGLIFNVKKRINQPFTSIKIAFFYIYNL